MNDMILILDYSSECSVEIARRLRAEQIYTRIVPSHTTAGQICELTPKGLILSGEALGTAGTLDADILKMEIPILAMGHAAHLLLAAQGGACAGTALSEKKAAIEYGKSELLVGISDGERYFSRAQTMMLPPDVAETASAGGCTIAFEHTEKKQYGVQFELERNDPDGAGILQNFVHHICGCSASWTLDAALAQASEVLEQDAAKGGKAMCAVSGGVDSTVAALLAYRVFGNRMTAVFVDTGLMREGEAEEIEAIFEALSVPLLRVDCADEIMRKLAGRHAEEEKRRVVVESIHTAMRRQAEETEGVRTLVLGTNYNDFLESGSGAPKWDDCSMRIVEPLLDMLKQEIRLLAEKLGMSAQFAERKPFPVLGLGARILGEVTAERLHALRMAETIFREEIREAGLERKLYKHFPVLASGEGTFGGEFIILRAVTLVGTTLVPARLPYDLVERTVQRIMESLPNVTRVFSDQTATQTGKETFS